MNAKFYDIPIGQITNIENKSTSQITDEHHNKDTKYKEQLTIKILNGKYEGKRPPFIINTLSHKQTV